MIDGNHIKQNEVFCGTKEEAVRSTDAHQRRAWTVGRLGQLTRDCNGVFMDGEVMLDQAWVRVVWGKGDDTTWADCLHARFKRMRFLCSTFYMLLCHGCVGELLHETVGIRW